MPDDTAIRDFAATQPGMQWKWKTEQKPGGWRATVGMGYPEGAHPMWGSGPGLMETEQEALDKAASHAISYWEGSGARIAFFPNGKPAI